MARFFEDGMSSGSRDSSNERLLLREYVVRDSSLLYMENLDLDLRSKY